jgi:flagellar biosynthesis protein FliR
MTLPDPLAKLFAPEQWPTFAFVSTRVTGFMLTAPLFSMPVLPRLARAAITVVLSIVLLATVPGITVPQHTLDIPVPLAMELLIGVVVGLTAAVLVQGVALAGEVLSLQMGLSLAPALAPIPDLPVSAMGQLTTWIALLAYLGTGGHLLLIRGLADSLHVLPPGSPIDLAGGASSAVAIAGGLFRCALKAAAPVMVTLLLVNVALAILSKAVPQLNAMMVSLPVTFGVGMIMLGLALPIVAATVGGWMQTLPQTVTGALEAFRPAH